jgi:NAD(P)H dehydrogenase (quinone)
MIVVTGATGQLGRLVIDQLVKIVPASQVVATVRDPAKADELQALGVQVRRADYTDPQSLDAALDGATKVLLVSSNAVGQRVAQHRAVIESAVRNQVKLIAYTSILHADTTPLSLASEHVATEQLLAASGLPVALLRNGWYTENYTATLPATLQHGAPLIGSSGEGRISTAPRADYAAAAVAVLTQDGQGGKVYELAGDQGFTMAELAAEVSRRSGRQVGYQDMPEADFAQALRGFGLPDEMAEAVADSSAKAANGALFDDSRQLSRLIGRPTVPMADTVAAAVTATLKSVG